MNPLQVGARCVSVAAVGLSVSLVIAGCSASADESTQRALSATVGALAGTDLQTSTVDDRVLLWHKPSKGSDTALLTGALGANSAGCITVDGAIVVLPSTDVLLLDGGLRRGGRQFFSGDDVRLGGGFSPVADAVQSLCGKGRYFYAGSAA